MLPRSAEVTGLLKAWSGGDEAALKQLADRVYDELRHIARRYMRNERASNTLQTTALVHEAYIRLCAGEPIACKDRADFFAVAAQQLRRVLVDDARRVQSDKRGGGRINANLLEPTARCVRLTNASLL